MNNKSKISLLISGLLSFPLVGLASLTSGPYIGLGVGAQNFAVANKTTLQQGDAVNPPDTVQSIFRNKVPVDGFLGNVYLGLQYSVCGYFLGIEGEYQYTSNKQTISKFDLDAPGDPTTSEIHLRAKQAYGASLALGYELICHAAIYVRGGYLRGEFESDGLEGGEIGHTGKFSQDLDGYLLGFGAQMEVCHGLGVRLEYRYVHYCDDFAKNSESNKWLIPAVPGLSDEFKAFVNNKYTKLTDNQMLLSINYTANML